MKKFVLFIALCLLAPSTALAADLGLYVAPKIGWSYVIMDEMKTRAEVSGLGSAQMKDDGDGNAFMGGLAIGYDFNVKHGVPVRTELEYMYRSRVDDTMSVNVAGSRASSKQKYDIQTLMVNAYYDFNTNTIVTPYVGGGIGLAFVDGKASGSLDDVGVSLNKDSTTNFAWNIGAGVGFDVTDSATIDLGYRFAGFGEAESKSREFAGGALRIKNETNYLFAHEVLLALRWTF